VPFGPTWVHAELVLARWTSGLARGGPLAWKEGGSGKGRAVAALAVSLFKKKPMKLPDSSLRIRIKMLVFHVLSFLPVPMRKEEKRKEGRKE